MPEQQLNVWIPEDYKTFLDQCAKRENRTVKAIIKGLIEREMAQARGEEMERQSLPAMRAMVREEVQRGTGELYTRLHDSVLGDLRNDLKESLHQNTTKLAKLLTRTVRDSGILRRLLYSLVSKATGREFAAKAYEHAEEMTRKELSERVTALPLSPLLEKELEG